MATLVNKTSAATSVAKSQIRQQFLKARANLSPEERENRSRRLSEHLAKFLMQISADAIGTYSALPEEANPDWAVKACGHIRWAYPAIAEGSMHFRLPRSAQPQDWRRGPYGILEPTTEASAEIGVGELKAMLVPGVGFDRHGGRIGFGKGYYDRAIQNFNGLKIGIGFSAQLSSEALPSEEHDLRLDWLVTDEGIHGPFVQSLAGSIEKARSTESDRKE